MKGGNLAGIDTCWFNPYHKPNNLGIDVTYEIDDLGAVADIISNKK